MCCGVRGGGSPSKKKSTLVVRNRRRCLCKQESVYFVGEELDGSTEDYILNKESSAIR